MIDKRARNAPTNISKNIPDLTKYLVHNYSNDLHKVRSFYTWIAYNIEYDTEAYSNNIKRINQSEADILKRKKAVCLGFASLFKMMCEQANIPSLTINGYTKNSLTNNVDLSTPDHAWNAVFLNNRWHLIDVTWGSGNQKEWFEYYFLCPPEKLIYSHLPADPMWQLLDCPLQAGIFIQSDKVIKKYLDITPNCFNHEDSIAAFLKLTLIERNLKTALDQYHFNPAEKNKRELGHSYMDLVNTLHDQAAALEFTDSIEAIKAIHLQIILYCKIGEKYIDLYDHQKENLAYTHLNYGVALSKEIPQQQNPALVLEEMLFHFNTSKNILTSLPQNDIRDHGLSQIESYIEWVRKY